MGVQGLLSVCLRQQNTCTEGEEDLVQIAKQRDGIELLVDFKSFQYMIMDKFWTALSALRGNPFLRILGGEFGSLDRYVTKLIEDLKSLKIKLVFFDDGAKGSSAETLRQKLDTWIKRHDEDIKKMSLILDMCRRQIDIYDLEEKTYIHPVSLEDQFVSVIKRCGCEFHQTPAGEADLLLIKALIKRRGKAYAILSNDSDFCVFPESRFIPIQLFDTENDLKLGEPLQVQEKPRSLMVKVITTEKVMSMLQLHNHRLLVEMSIVSGNDYTRPFMRGDNHYLSGLDIQGIKNVENIAHWIKHYGNIQSHPFLSREMNENSEFRDAVNYSRKLYSLQAEPEAPPQRSDAARHIAGGIKSNKYPTNFMSIHNGHYWYRMSLEDLPSGEPCTERALRLLRKYIYIIVLPRDVNSVKEYGRGLSGNFEIEDVTVVKDSTVPSINEIEDDRTTNQKHFQRIMSHQEGDKDRGFWNDGMKTGFIMYLLRYFLLQNWKKNLCLEKEEYLALVATVFSENNEAEYQKIFIRPTGRCVTIGSWFQTLYRHVSMLARALSIASEFPLPSEIFCGSRWTAMYMVYTERVDNEQVRFKVDSIIQKKRGMIDQIVDGILNQEVMEIADTMESLTLS